MSSSFQWAALYAAKGWHVVPCHGIDNGKCTCPREDCATKGKHPLLGSWQTKSTIDEDELSHYFDGSKPYNVGVQLGEKSGIIDIEYDDEKGRATAERFGLDKCATPTFTSKRSTHRIFKWSSKLPRQAVYKLAGLEIRIGGGERGAQSIFPPSSHASGSGYAWVAGMGPDDVEPVDIPRELLQAIVNECGEDGPSGERKSRTNDILHKGVGEGGRHSEIVRFAAKYCLAMMDPHDPREQQDVLKLVMSVNKTSCVPPLSDEEVIGIWRGELAWAIRKVGAEGISTTAEKKAALEKHLSGEPEKTESEAPKPAGGAMSMTGLEYRVGEGEDDQPQWWPGRWRLDVYRADPPRYVLHLPVYRDGAMQEVSVSMDAATFRNPSGVATAILEATHTVMIDDIPEQWAAIWNGKGGGKGKKPIRGLRAKLLDCSTQLDDSPEKCRFAMVASWVLEALVPRDHDEADEDNTPDPQGNPKWILTRKGEWEVWATPAKVWEIANKSPRAITQGDFAKVLDLMLKVSRQDALKVARPAAGVLGRPRYRRFTKSLLGALQRLTEGSVALSEQGEIESPAPSKSPS